MKHILSKVICALMLCPVGLWASSITIGYPEFKPYTYTDEGEAKGVGIEAAKILFKKLGYKAEFNPTHDYGSAVKFLSNNRIDGFLLGSQNQQRDAIAVFSQPITDNNWSWFTLAEQGNIDLAKIDKESFRVTTHQNANTHIWLKNEGYSAIYPTTDIQAMLRQLHVGRVDAIFLAEAVLLDALEQSKLNKQDLNITVQKSKPFGIYISKEYLKTHDKLMKQLNEQIVQLLSAQ